MEREHPSSPDPERNQTIIAEVRGYQRTFGETIWRFVDQVREDPTVFSSYSTWETNERVIHKRIASDGSQSKPTVLRERTIALSFPGNPNTYSFVAKKEDDESDFSETSLTVEQGGELVSTVRIQAREENHLVACSGATDAETWETFSGVMDEGSFAELQARGNAGLELLDEKAMGLSWQAEERVQGWKRKVFALAEREKIVFSSIQGSERKNDLANYADVFGIDTRQWTEKAENRFNRDILISPPGLAADYGFLFTFDTEKQRDAPSALDGLSVNFLVVGQEQYFLDFQREGRHWRLRSKIEGSEKETVSSDCSEENKKRFTDAFLLVDRLVDVAGRVN